MALDQEYFDNIHIDVVKQKYYNANKVRAVLEDIQREAAALETENARLRRELEETQEQKVQLSEALFTAQMVCRDMLLQAREEADGLLGQAKQQSRGLQQESDSQMEYAAQIMAKCFNRLKVKHELAIDQINREWQSFLQELVLDDELSQEEHTAASGQA